MATIASMVYNIEAQTSSIEQSMKQVTSLVDDFTSHAIASIASGSALGSALERMGEAAITAATQGVEALINAVDDLVMRGSKVQDISDSFERLTEGAGHAGDALLGRLREGTRDTIGDFDLMKRTNQDLAAGLNLTDQQFGTLAQGAFALAKATGGDAKSALDSMNDAMLTGRTRAVALLTGKIDLKSAEEEYARSLGTTADHLTAEGKLEAARSSILDAVTASVGRLGEQHLTLADELQQVRTAWENFQDDLGLSLTKSHVLQAGIETLGAALLDAFGGDRESAIHNLTVLIDNMAIVVVGAIAEITKATTSWLSELDLILNLAAKVPVLGDNFKLVAAGADIATSTSLNLSAALFKSRDAMQALADTGKPASFEASATSIGRIGDAANTTGLVMERTAAEAKKYADAWTALNSLGTDFHDTVDQINPELEQEIEYYLQLGASVHELAAAYPELSNAQIAAVGEMVKVKAAADANDAALRKWIEGNQELDESVAPTISAVQALNAGIMGIDTSFDGWNQTIMGTLSMFDALDADLDKSVAKVQTLAGDWIKASDAQKAFDSGGSVSEADLTDPAYFARSQPGIAKWLSAGFSLAQATELYSIGPPFDNIFANTLTNDGEKGPRVPGFAEGGIVTLGERGPERVALPYGSAVYPTGTGPAGNVTVNVTISGVFDPAARRQLVSIVKQELERDVRQVRKLPSV